MVASSADPASINPATALLSMPGWDQLPWPPEEEQAMKAFRNGDARLLIHGGCIVREDDLDRRWEAATGEEVGEIIFFSRHTAVSNRPALTVHPIGTP